MATANAYAELAGALHMDPWAARAACKFPGAAQILDEGGPEAKALCAACPVIRQCTDWLLDLQRISDPGFFAAGMTQAERQTARRRRKLAVSRRKRAAQKPAAKTPAKPKPKAVKAKPAAAKEHAEVLPAGMKRCSKCRDVKRHDEFYAETRRADGRSGVCMTCKRVANAAAAKYRRARATAGRNRRRSDAAYATQTRRPRSKAAA